MLCLDVAFARFLLLAYVNIYRNFCLGEVWEKIVLMTHIRVVGALLMKFILNLAFSEVKFELMEGRFIFFASKNEGLWEKIFLRLFYLYFPNFDDFYLIFIFEKF
jgi:hypothetical protein